MIAELKIENFALFRKTRLDLAPGLNVLTGESGSGKSLVLESLAALFGARLSPERIGPWGDSLTIRAALEWAPDDTRWSHLEPYGIEPDSVLIVERQASRDGRSSYRVQGQLVPSQSVRAIGEDLMEYVGQNQIGRAARPQYILDWVDHYGHLELQRQAVAERFRAWREAEQHVRELDALSATPEGLADKRAIAAELDALDLRPDEDEALSQELAKLRAGRLLIETSQALYQALEGTDYQAGLLAGLDEALKLAEHLARYDASLEDLVRGVQSAVDAMTEARGAVSVWMANLDLDPRRLEELETRADVLSRVKRRHGPELEDVLAFMETLKQEIEQLDNLGWERERAQRRAEEAHQQYLEAAGTLTQARSALLSGAGDALSLAIREMEMPTGAVRIERRVGEAAAHGMDVLEVLFSANQGQSLKPLAKVASGGELARVALALAVVGQSDDGIVYVFDEVDQGLGGASADRVGQLLKTLGHRTQVLAVSHQPVVAARADHHVAVQKTLDAHLSRSDATVLEGDARVREVARMLSGTHDTVALNHARSLLGGRSGG